METISNAIAEVIEKFTTKAKEYTITDNNEVYIIAYKQHYYSDDVILTDEQISELKAHDKDMFWCYNNNKRLTKVQVKKMFTEDDYLFAKALIDEDISVKFVRGYEYDDLSSFGFIANKDYKTEHSYLDGQFVICSNKRCTSVPTIKQVEYFDSLGGEVAFTNLKRIYRDFSKWSISMGIELLQRGEEVTLKL